MIADDFHGQLARLRQQLVEYFDDEELRTLCFDLGIDCDSLPVQGKEGKARELISLLVRTGRMAEFTETCRRLRPNVSWEFKFGTTPSNPTVVLDEMFGEATRYHIKGDLGYALQLYRQLQQIAPAYPRIDATIAAVEREMQARYVGPYGRVREGQVIHPPPPAYAPVRPMPAVKPMPARSHSGCLVGIGIAIIVLVIVGILVYLWLRSVGG